MEFHERVSDARSHAIKRSTPAELESSCLFTIIEPYKRLLQGRTTIVLVNRVYRAWAGTEFGSAWNVGCAWVLQHHCSIFGKTN